MAFKKKKITALIPARGGSKGIKNKNLRIVGGKKLISYSISSALKSRYIDKVVVSTDSLKIANYSKKNGAIIPGLRPSIYSKDSSSTESVISHYIKNWISEDEIIILLQPTSPIRSSATIDKAITKFFNGKYDSLLSLSKVKNNFIWKLKGKLSIHKYDIKNRKRRQDIKIEDSIFYENGSIYIFSVNKFRKHQNRLFGKIGSIILDKYESIDIDDKDDLKIAKSIIEKL